MNKKIILAIIIFIALIFGSWIVLTSSRQKAQAPSAPKPTATATYACNDNKSITAEFYKASSTPPAVPGEPPTPGGSVHLKLSDGRTMTLAQTISADGARYSNGDPNIEGSETFVFWSKGNGAIVLENNEQKSYTNCIEVAANPGELPSVFHSSSTNFIIRYPSDFSVNSSYKYQELGPNKVISGVSFTIPESTATGTNLAPDTYISVEQIPQISPCTANLFLPDIATSTTLEDAGITYSFASSTGAGAGNRYEESVYALPYSNPCTAVRYFIHYSVLENYPAGAVQEFDKNSLQSTFDSMRRTLTLAS
jgi:membrane-bound inhibitor of C-type lysozyme